MFFYKPEDKIKTAKKVAFYSIFSGVIGTVAGFLSHPENRKVAAEKVEKWGVKAKEEAENAMNYVEKKAKDVSDKVKDTFEEKDENIVLVKTQDKE